MKWKYLIIVMLILGYIPTVSSGTLYCYDFYEYKSGGGWNTLVWCNHTYQAHGYMDIYWYGESRNGGCETDYQRVSTTKYQTAPMPTYNTVYSYWIDPEGGPYPKSYHHSRGSIGNEIFQTGCTKYMTAVVENNGGQVVSYGVSTGGYFYPTDVIEYTVSGNLCGIENITLNMWLNGDWIPINSGIYNQGVDTYSFDVLDDQLYKLIFGDNHEYEFTVSGNVNYDRDICTYSTFNIKDNCGNPIINSYGYYTSEDDVMCYYFERSSVDVLNIEQTYTDIIVHSFDGVQGYHIDNPLPNIEITYSLVNPTIQWINTIWVYDAIEKHLLNDALVTLTQDCIIDTSLYPIRSQYTDAGGYAVFGNCELNNANLNISLTGYKPFIGYIGIGDNHAFKQDQLIMIGLYPNDDPINESHYNYTNWTTSIWFKNNDSIITSEIYDTDEYVDLYYHNNNTYDSPMVLNFEMGLAGTFNTYNPVLSWLILSEESGYKRIYNDNFSNHLNYYKATLKESEIEGWDKMKYLSVINHTQNVGDNHVNLTTNIWFAGTINNRIEYKEDILITSYANSNNSTLLNVSLELYNETNMIEYINLTWGDFSHPSDKWYYRWSPTSDYEKNKNYTVRMFGFNYQFLKEDMVYTTDLHKNKLTVRVIDNNGDYLTNSYVVLEGYGSLSTGSTFYNSYHNLDNGMYQYKAEKNGYVGAGWEIVNLSDVNEIVNYTLTLESSSSINLPLHFSDSDIQSFFYPLMFFLLMCLLLGGLKYVAK